MTLHVLHGGNGYQYLTRTVASADVRRSAAQNLADFYQASGTPPGVWSGRGAEILGVTGQITTAQMQALFGEGVHPNTEQMLADAAAAGVPVEESVAATRLGQPFYALGRAKTPISEIHKRLVASFTAGCGRTPSRREWAAMRRTAATEHLATESGREPTMREVHKALADERRRTRQSVAGYDCTFTAPKSVAGVLFALGSDTVRQTIWQAHLESVHETLRFAEQHYALAKRGRGGPRIIDTEGFTVAQFTHWDNRSGDPNLHTHAVISAMVLGVDGRWSCLDARPLHHAAVALSCRYNATMIGKLQRRLGVRFEERSRGRGKKPVLEVVGIPEELIQLFSRRAEIQTATEQLVIEYRRQHGHSPSKATQIRLAQVATLSTRSGKPVPRALQDQLAEAEARADAWLAEIGDHRSGRQLVADLLADAAEASAPTRYHSRSVAVAAATAAGVDAVRAGDRELVAAAVDTELRRFHFDTTSARAAARDEVLVLLAPGDSESVIAEVQQRLRARFDAEKIAADVVTSVATRRATWTETHIRAETEDQIAICDFADDAAQRASVEQVVALARDNHSLQLAIDPDPPPAALRRRNGDSVFAGPSSTTIRYTSEAVLDAEAALQQAAQQPTPNFVTRDEVTAAVAAVEQANTKRGAKRRLTLGQRRVVEHLCTAGTRLAVAVGPAGAGKTTALQAVVRAWMNAGQTVIAVSPQKSAARVLANDIGIPADTIASLLWAHRNGTGAPISPGAMILIDEAGMASTADLAALQQLADATGAVVRWVGDPWQLSAVEAGGALRLIAADTHAPEMGTVVRFKDPAEAAATLHVRNGDPAHAWQFYDSHNRVHSGLAAELREQMLTAHLRDIAEGMSSLMMAATTDDVHRLNGAAQAAHAGRGTVDVTSSAAQLSDGHRGHVGDIVVTRRNARRIRVTGGSRDGSPVTNGDRWRVVTVHADGSLTVIGADHRGRVHLPDRYVIEDVELGYACTVHRAQGVTVDRAHLLMNTSLGRALAYVGLSRGRIWNGLYLATDTLPDSAPPERAPDEPATAGEVFARVLARDDDNISATEVLREEMNRLDDPRRLTEIYTHACHLLGVGLATELLDRALPAVHFRQVQRAPAFPLLADTLTVADQIGMDVPALINDIVTNGGVDDRGEALLSARDTAALLSARADRLIAAHLDPSRSPAGGRQPHIRVADTGSERLRAVRDVTFTTVPPLPSRHPGVDLELADYAGRLRNRLIGTQNTPPLHGEESAATAPAPSPTVSSETPESAEPVTALSDRSARVRDDYDYYVGKLAHDHARYLLDHALPPQVLAHVQSAGGWSLLLDTIALADWHELNPASLVAEITNGDLVFLLHERDAASVLCARADAWIANHATATSTLNPSAEQQSVTAGAVSGGRSRGVSVGGRRGSRFRATRDLPRPHALRPIPPAHPGMDTITANYADALCQRLLNLPDDAPDWRARASQRANLTALTGGGDDSGPDDPDLQPPPDYDLGADLWGEPDPQPDCDDGSGEAGDEWISVADAHTDQLYLDLAPIDRVIRIGYDLAAAEAHVAQLRQAINDGCSEHQLAIAPLVRRCRERVDALRPLLLAYRDAHQQAEDAELDAATAEDAYQQALRRQPEQADEQFLAFLHNKAAAVADDPGIRAKLEGMLDQYRAAMTERAAAEVDADIAQARLLAADARAWADGLREEADTAKRELDDAAGADGVVDESDVHRMRLLGDELAIDTLNSARAELRRLPPYLHRARMAAANELQSSGLDRRTALAEIDRRTSTPGSDHHGEDIGARIDSGTATDQPAAVDEQQLAEELRSDPLRMRSDTDLDLLVRSLRNTAGHAYPFLADPVVSQAERVRDMHARLAKQVAAIDVAEWAMLAAEQDRADAPAREAVDAATTAAAALGAPQHRWPALRARAADTEALAAEIAAAELADAREQQLREQADQRADLAAQDLATALAEQRRRAELSPTAAEAETRLRTMLGFPLSSTGDLATPAVSGTVNHAQADTEAGL
ncbi:MobF family relaxase [Nocardia sp. NPDC049220]|uniref:MobF family relaxase n=1 Tax=Nocardia sp. NPDC049220 TaxID=3155273 RepID=UPI0033DDB747